MQIILASQSPRRREILTTLGVNFKVVVSETDETCAETDPGKLVEELSRRKAVAVQKSGYDGEEYLIIGCDTVVATADEILGKPKDAADAKRMLQSLSGKPHRVFSGLTILAGGKTYTAHDCTEVLFTEMTDAEINSYVATEEPMDKAGAYAIQGRGARFIAGIHGCYYNVVGLPVALLSRMVKENGLPNIFTL